MRKTLLKLYLKGQMLLDVIREEQGQDLVEYAAVISLVVLGITAGMNTLANGINDAMTAVGGKINSVIG
jgi:pilus assembly protein Flp/PilA